MNGAHDMGGMHGFGPVVQEADEPIFHADWEARSLALNLAAGGGRWNIDMSRFARENTPPVDYLSRSYYEMWAYGLEKLIVQTDMVTQSELEAARSGAAHDRVTEPRLAAGNVFRAMRSGGSARVDSDVAPLFVAGDAVRASMNAPESHTRCPRYVRGRAGVIDRDHGVFVYPDTHAHGLGKKPQHIYAVRFEAEELWGDQAQGGAVYVDLWDDYLEPAPGLEPAQRQRSA